MKRTLTTFGLAALAVGTLSTAAVAQSSTFTANLDALNGTGDDGTATVEVDGSQATVTVRTSNTSPGAPHAQHIHIGGENACPTSTADQDDDGFISTPEGQPAYGGIKVSLTTSGDVGAESALAVDRFPVADDSGTIDYQRSFELPSGVTADDIANGVIVQHGFAESDLGDDPAAYDGPDSPLMEGVPQEATLPSSCGVLAAAPTGGVAAGFGGTATSTDAGLAALGVIALGGTAFAVRRRRTES